jgi:hypothetical protein
MSQVFGIDRSHVQGELRLGRAIKRILMDKVVRANGDYIVTPQNMAKLERAYDRTFPEMDMAAKEFLKQVRRFKARKK